MRNNENGRRVLVRKPRNGWWCVCNLVFDNTNNYNKTPSRCEKKKQVANIKYSLSGFVYLSIYLSVEKKKNKELQVAEVVFGLV